MSLSALTVHGTGSMAVMGTTATIRVIGSSHYLAAPDLGLYELCSCRPIAPASDGVAVAVDAREGTTIDHRTDAATVETTVETRPIESFPATATFDVAHRFDAHAYTALHATEAGYCTYHTYPEFDACLHTETIVRR
ncbi:hypothetical protein BRD17_00505 [Halobacteriales archaeon SW_7_68_16]|nr:MAG: hypothetical protein BRD17_00505 [Halobacteriales archaeon SW_7_68_16]